jgi:hypothetical protein
MVPADHLSSEIQNGSNELRKLVMTFDTWAQAAA